jgi:hypothetical protein
MLTKLIFADGKKSERLGWFLILKVRFWNFLTACLKDSEIDITKIFF